MASDGITVPLLQYTVSALFTDRSILATRHVGVVVQSGGGGVKLDCKMLEYFRLGT